MPSVHKEIKKSPLYCLACKTHASKYSQNQFLRSLVVYCQKCDQYNDESEVGVKVVPSSAQYIKIAPTRQSYWYHSTYVDRWGEKYTEFGDPIYLGTRNAAIRRYKDLASDPTFTKESGWLYKVKLKPRVKIHRYVLDDDHLMPSTAEFQDRVVRYVNLFESVGSISLVTRADQFDIVDVVKLKKHER